MKLTLSNHESVAEWVKQICAPVTVGAFWFGGNKVFRPYLVILSPAHTVDAIKTPLFYYPNDFLVEEEIVRWASS